ncbi:MAG: rpoE [Frankiales bacterium]|nr:rpoE [Frankiales bacterium]
MPGGRAANSEQDLMRALHDKHAAALWAFTLRLTGGDRAAAEDVVQETLFRAWKSPASPVLTAEEVDSARGWLYTVARRIVIDEWRSRSARPEKLVDEMPEYGVSDATDRLVDAQVMVEAMNQLSVDHRSVLQEMFYKRSTVRETAATLGIAEGTVKSRSHYALRALKVALTEMGVSG